MTKEELVAEISRLIGIAPPPMSTGSREPRAILDQVNLQLGLGLTNTRSKTTLARGIVEATGARWIPDYESRGEVITALGLEAVLHAVESLVAA